MSPVVGPTLPGSAPFIVAEVSKTWIDGKPAAKTPPLAQQFELLLEHNRQRGYRLVTFQLHRMLVGPRELHETLIAVFEHEPLQDGPESQAPVVPRVITAQMSSRCKRCRKWIGPGMKILYAKGAGATHLDEAACTAALPDAPLEPFAGDRDAEFAVVSQLLEAAPWTFARTMPDVPHEWSLRKQWADSEAFTHCVRAIRQLGKKRRWRSMTNLKLDVHERYYWTMDDVRCPASLVTLINRAVRADYE